MRVVLQRVSRASVIVAGETVGHIERGLVAFVGIAVDDQNEDADYLIDKIAALRIFDDSQGRMNVSLEESGGALLVVSQFTLYGDARRGRRPSWSDAAQPAVAEPLYEYFVAAARRRLHAVETGSFRRTMQIESINEGPVTILLESRKTF